MRMASSRERLPEKRGLENDDEEEELRSSRRNPHREHHFGRSRRMNSCTLITLCELVHQQSSGAMVVVLLLLRLHSFSSSLSLSLSLLCKSVAAL